MSSCSAGLGLHLGFRIKYYLPRFYHYSIMSVHDSHDCSYRLLLFSVVSPEVAK